MPEPNDPFDSRDDREGLFPGFRRRHGTGSSPSLPLGPILLIVLLIVVAGAAGWYWYTSRAEPEPQTASPTAPPAAEPDEPDVPPLDLPELEASDAFVRGLVAALSEHPRLAAWLATDELVRRFVGTVVDIAGGRSPSSRLPFLVPEAEFEAQEANGGLRIAPATYRRYDVLAEAFVSLDTEDSVLLYRQLHPLFEEAYAELGIPDRTFDETLAVAIRNLRDVQVPPEPPEVVLEEGIYEYRDPQVEARSPAHKHLLRMGPENASRVQAKLAELEAALDLPAPPS